MSDRCPPPQSKINQSLTRGAGEDLEGLQQLQFDGGLVLKSRQGEKQRLSQVTALQQLQPVAGRGWMKPCRHRFKKKIIAMK